MRKQEWDYVNYILQESLAKKDTKCFWRHVKSNRQDSMGVSPLQEKGVLQSDSSSKAQILNRQFQSVFTMEDVTTILTLPDLEQLWIDVKGVAKQLATIKTSKAPGPNNLPNILFKELSEELAPFLTALFNQSVNSESLPEDWLNAYITPLFKKGNRHDAVNYRPVSLTSICCKLLEHIVCSHVRAHLDRYNILSRFQHGFRKLH